MIIDGFTKDKTTPKEKARLIIESALYGRMQRIYGQIYPNSKHGDKFDEYEHGKMTEREINLVAAQIEAYLNRFMKIIKKL